MRKKRRKITGTQKQKGVPVKLYLLPPLYQTPVEKNNKNLNGKTQRSPNLLKSD